MELKTLNNIDVKNKLVLLRIDINSPVAEKKIIDNPRLDASAVTIRELLKKSARLVIIAHQGRPDTPDFVPLDQHAKLLSNSAKNKIGYIDDLFGNKAIKAITR